MSRIHEPNFGPVGWTKPPANRPESPWRKRYGGSTDPTFCESKVSTEIESGFRPIYPEVREPYGLEGNPGIMPLDEWRQALANNPNIGFNCPTAADVDRIFLSERFQTSVLHGVRSWQLPSINLPPHPSPGAFTVSEAGWADLLTKSHWYDYRPDPADKNAVPTTVWSVDDPAVWTQLAPCIQLTNRFLILLMHTQWFSSLMKYSSQDPENYPTKLVSSVGGRFGHIPPIPDPSNPGKASYRVPWFPIQPSSVPVTKKEVAFNLQEVERRGATIFWTFYDSQDPGGLAVVDKITSGGGAYGFASAEPTWLPDGNQAGHCVLIRLNADYLKPLMSPPQTPEDEVERNTLQAACAITMLHELIHALFVAGYQTFQTTHSVPEPLMGDEWKAELGHSGEQALFGGLLQKLPSTESKISAPSSRPGYRPIVLALPQWREGALLGSDHIAWTDREVHYPSIPQAVTEHVLQPGFLNRVTSDLFWNNKTAPDLLRELNLVTSSGWTQVEAPFFRGVSARLRAGAGSSRQARDWVERTKIWDLLRAPWYQREYLIWQCTPYSLLGQRTCVSRFGGFAANQDLLSCVATTEKLADTINTNYHFLVVGGNCPPPPALSPGSRKPIVPSHAPSHYLFAVLLTIMRATMEWECVKSAYVKTVHIPPVSNRYHPSLAALQARPVRVVTRPTTQKVDLMFQWGGRRQAPNLDQSKLTPQAARLVLLREAEKHLCEYAYRFQILSQEPFVRAVTRAIKDLTDETTKNGQDYLGWLTWPFSMPEYDGTLKTGSIHPDGVRTVWKAADLQDQAVQDSMAQLLVEMYGSPVTPQPDGVNPQPTNTTQPASSTGPRAIVGTASPGGGHPPPPSGTASRVQPIAADDDWSLSPKRIRTSWLETDHTHFPAPKRRRTSWEMERRYWTIGEVGNHSSEADRWAVVDDQQGGFDVYDVTDHPLLQTEHGLEEYTEMTQHGLVLHQDAHAWALENRCLGKLILSKSPEELFEMDGQDGRPHWVYAGGDIFDLADVSLATADEMAALRSSHQGDAATAAEKHGISMDRLRSILTVPCATIRFHYPATRRGYRPFTYSAFTIEELGRHIFPRRGHVYMAIDNGVYDIQDLASSHPGGSNLITTFAGRDATFEFKRDHPNWEALLARMTRIGHVIPTFSLTRFRALRPDEVCFDNIWIYRVTRRSFVQARLEWTLDHTEAGRWDVAAWELAREEFEQQFDAIEPFLGRVVEEGEAAPRVFAPLRRLRQLVVGRRPAEADGTAEERRARLPAMTRGEMARYNHVSEKPAPLLEEMGWTDEDPEVRWERIVKQGPRAVYVAIGEDVYDVTDIMLWADDAVKERLGKYAGQQLTDPDLIHDIVERHVSNGIVARLVEGPALETPKPSKEWFDEERKLMAEERRRLEIEAVGGYTYRNMCGTFWPQTGEETVRIGVDVKEGEPVYFLG